MEVGEDEHLDEDDNHKDMEHVERGNKVADVDTLDTGYILQELEEYNNKTDRA